MANILYLVHRIPYPPNKGDKIRSFHWLKHLTARHRVFLGTFVDDPADWEHAEKLESLCAGTCILPLDPRRARLRSLKGLLRGTALTLPYYADRRMKRWVARTVEERSIDAVLVFSSAMAQFVEPSWKMKKIIDFVDVDSDKWAQYSRSKPPWTVWIYRREAEKLLEFDRTVAGRFDVGLFVSEAEAGLFKRLAPEIAGRIGHIENGVDLEYFQGAREYPCPYAPGEQAFVFTGAMDYWANIDAVRWFAHQVFPQILKHHVEARFYIVGARPAEAVKALARQEGVVVTGSVPDIRPYLAHARLAVAPLRIARGIQNKVLEAMAMGKPVMATPMAMDGLKDTGELDVFVSEDPGRQAECGRRALRERKFLPRYSDGNRRFVEMRYSWDKHLEQLDALLAQL